MVAGVVVAGVGIWLGSVAAVAVAVEDVARVSVTCIRLLLGKNARQRLREGCALLLPLGSLSWKLEGEGGKDNFATRRIIHK